MAASTRRILGPLTTTFTPAPSCAVLTADIDYAVAGVWRAFGAQTCDPSYRNNGGVPLHDATSCWPPVSSDVTVIPSSLTWGFYSPGTICPSGHTSACTAIAGGVSQWQLAFDILVGETAVGCCPSGYTCTKAPWGFQTCHSQAELTSFSIVTCSYGSLINPTILSLPSTATVTSDGSTITSTVTTYQLYSPMIEIRWRSTDLTATSTAGPTTSTAPAASTSTSGNTSATDGNPGSELSTGAQAGIGVGVALGVLFVLVVALLIWRRSRKQAHAAPSHSEHEHQPMSKVAWTHVPVQKWAPGEMDAAPKAPREMYAGGLQGTRTHELSGN